MSTGLKANSDGSAAIQVGGTDVITLTSGGAATFVTSPTTVQAGTAAAPSITFSGDTNTGIYSPGADQVAIATGGTAAVTVSSLQNAGIGVAPSTVNNLAGYKSLEIGQPGNIIYAGLNQVILASNLKFDGSTGKYGASYPVAAYNLNGSVHTFSSAATGTANANVTVTDVMAVGLGTTLALQGATSQSGTGITFPATQSASSNANTLDDYEEGTWTPTIIGSSSTGTGTYTTQQGTYTKIGNTVRFQANIVWTAHTGTGQVQVGNYPFASTAETTPISLSFYNGTLFTSGQFVQAYKNASDTTSGTAQTNPTTSALTSVVMTNAGTMLVSGVYKVA